MGGASQRNNVLSASMSEETSTGNNRIIHHSDEVEFSYHQYEGKQPADYGTASNPIVIDDDDELGSSSLRHHTSTCQYSGHEDQIGPVEAEAEAEAVADANANENENDAPAAVNEPLLAQQIFDEVIIREGETITMENLLELVVAIDDIEEMALHRAEQLLDNLVAAYTQGMIDLHWFKNGLLVLRACVTMLGMVFGIPNPQIEVRTGLTQEEIEARMEPRIYRVFNNVSAEDVGTCCVCLDDFANNDQLGKLDCGHEFHNDCIQRWLVVKNECPICKKTALA